MCWILQALNQSLASSAAKAINQMFSNLHAYFSHYFRFVIFGHKFWLNLSPHEMCHFGNKMCNLPFKMNKLYGLSENFPCGQKTFPVVPLTNMRCDLELIKVHQNNYNHWNSNSVFENDDDRKYNAGLIDCVYLTNPWWWWTIMCLNLDLNLDVPTFFKKIDRFVRLVTLYVFLNLALATVRAACSGLSK